MSENTGEPSLSQLIQYILHGRLQVHRKDIAQFDLYIFIRQVRMFFEDSTQCQNVSPLQDLPHVNISD